MSQKRDQEPGSSEPQEPRVQQRNPNSGEGSGSALDAMLRKRRQGENHVEPGGGDPPDPAIGEGTQSK
jgi:hypothetical protein